VVFGIWDDYDRGNEVPPPPQWQARSPLSLSSLLVMERQFVLCVEHRLFVGFSHAAFLLLEPQGLAGNGHQAQGDAQRAALMDVVATGPAKLQVPRPPGKLSNKLGRAPIGAPRASAAKRERASSFAFSFLLVDHDRMSRLLLAQKLTAATEFKGLPAVCDQAEHGEAALQKLHDRRASSDTNDTPLREREYDVLIFDEHMGGSGGTLKGSEVIRKLRQEGCKSVIVSCSASCNESNSGPTGEFRSAGADICWTKPYPSSKQMYLDLARLLQPPAPRSV
jgi:CheY-like chemotaxis protein